MTDHGIVTDGAAQTVHEAMIADLCARQLEVQRTGFMRALATVGDYMRDLMAHDREWVAQVRIVPDAFAINWQTKSIVLFEVVDTHEIPESKKEAVAEIGWALDQDGYSIGIIRIDQAGATHSEIPMYATLSPEVSA
ncbi:hypothetical protein [Sphingomonas sp. PB4P5]|uniref:hypothetical protein n=1 Tax=Parasphingomonas puruogangriensis TaxID=3096155 RepID=UPI002FCB64F1